jgi:hypothetical protein
MSWIGTVLLFWSINTTYHSTAHLGPTSKVCALDIQHEEVYLLNLPSMLVGNKGNVCVCPKSVC